MSKGSGWNQDLSGPMLVVVLSALVAGAAVGYAFSPSTFRVVKLKAELVAAQTRAFQFERRYKDADEWISKFAAECNVSESQPQRPKRITLDERGMQQKAE